MKLSDWLKKPGNKLTQDALGIKLGVTQGRVSQIARNGTRDFVMIRKICEATGYEVGAEDLLPRGGAEFDGDAA